MIRVKHLYKEYSEDVKVLFDINFDFDDHKTYAIIGSSGGGKSTLIRCLNMLETPTSGSIELDNIELTNPKTDLNKMREKMGMVFQNFNLFAHMNVLNNVAYALKKVKKMNAIDAQEKATSLLKEVGLEHRLNAFPYQLSGGEKQRCSIARALAMDPEVLLLDEPTSALDPEMTTEVLKVLRNLHKQKMAMIIVTHEMRFAKEVSDYIIYMDKGTIVECSPTKDFFESPQSKRAKEFLEAML